MIKNTLILEWNQEYEVELIGQKRNLKKIKNKNGDNLIVKYNNHEIKLPCLKNLNYEIQKARDLENARIIKIKVIRKGNKLNKISWLFEIKTISKDLM